MSHHPALGHLLAAILESAEEGALVISLDGKMEGWSCGAERLYGFTAQEMTGQPLSRLVPHHELHAMQLMLAQAAAGNFRRWENTGRLHKNGSRISLNITWMPVRNEQGAITGILEFGRARHSYVGDALAEEPLSLIIEQMPGFLWTTDQNLRITSNWGSGLPLSRNGSVALVGRNVGEFLECSDPYATPLAEHYDALRGVTSHFEYNWRKSILEIRLEPMRTASGQISGCLGLAVDVTSQKQSEEETLFQARHDALTGLANYREFMDRLEREVRRASRSHHFFTLLLLDLDDLKRINDLQGHLAGNRALRRLADVMNEHCRSTDLAARYGGDEFAVVLIDSDKSMAEQVAQRIEHGLPADQEKPCLSVTIGIAVYPDDGRTPAELIEAADRRLYRRKRTHNTRAISAPDTAANPMLRSRRASP
jgi:diguanylate cyclase (GGDEF)-like protein/PAS domain S-box-containing protein